MWPLCNMPRALGSFLANKLSGLETALLDLDEQSVREVRSTWEACVDITAAAFSHLPAKRLSQGPELGESPVFALCSFCPCSFSSEVSGTSENSLCDSSNDFYVLFYLSLRISCEKLRHIILYCDLYSLPKLYFKNPL